ncbi:MAG: hypothetical protein OHK006_17310 [Thermodesulfovibrionales bacterium]
MRSNRLLAVVSGLVLLVFCAGSLKLLSMRFEAGDIYPPYSSLRTDPLGVRAYYEALERIPGMTVARNYRGLDLLPAEGDAALFIAGIERYSLQHADEGVAKALDAFVRQGGRLVLLFYPDRSNRFRPGEREKPADEKRSGNPGEDQEQAKKEEHTKERAAEEDTGRVSLYDRWGFGTALLEKKDGTGQGKRPRPKAGQAVRVAPDASLPASLAWHSDRFFSGLDSAWQVLYAVDGNAVMIERQLGSGTIAAATDSYFVSNEAVVKERHPALFAWIAGPHRRVLFDESLHGVQERPGVAALARAYRLEGMAAVFLLLAGLFLWKNATGLGPPGQREDEDAAQTAGSGRDSLAGLVGLLRRNIPASQVVKMSVDEWKKTMRYRRQEFREEARKIGAAVAGAQDGRTGNPVALYRQISKILSERNNR